MSITSLSFYGLVAATLILYYLFPKKFRWFVLLIASIVFVIEANSFSAAIITFSMAIGVYLVGLLIGKLKENHAVFSKLLYILSLVAIFATLFTFKEQLFFVNTGNFFLGKFGSEASLNVVSLIAPLGISYFSLTLVGYLTQVFWGMYDAEKNPLKFASFAFYFPTLTSGPILRYNDTKEELFAIHKFDYEQICFGLQRIIWGFFKKLVISERLAIIVNAVYGDYTTYNGLYVLIAVLAYPLQLYTDFSGCMDIMLGISQLFGVKLPENFDTPFAAKSIAEFWRKWHITLGLWLKEFIFYPLLRSKALSKLGKACKKKWGRKTGAKIPTWIGLAVTWVLIGFWHGGGYNYIFGVGIFMGAIIILSEILEPVWSFLKRLFRISEDSFSWKLFQMIRTYFLFSIGNSFFRATSMSDGIALWKALFKEWNPWILFDGSFYDLGLDAKDIRLLLLMIVLLLVLGIVKLIKQEDLRIIIGRQNLVFRWLVYLDLIFAILIFGEYGYGYDAAAFIYGGF